MLPSYFQTEDYKVPNVIISLNSQITLMVNEYNITLPELPLLINLSAIKHFRKALNTVKQTVQALLKQEQKEYDTSQMLHFIEQRCNDFKDNQTRMINSILQRTQDKIVIDRLEVDNDLITDPASIRTHTADHFQNIVGQPKSDGSIPDDWIHEYSPLDSVDDAIYATLYDLPSFTEWIEIVRLAPANKAPGPSGISYDLIKHLGPIALDVLYQITCSCFRLQAIPTGWKRAAIYPIPKPTSWHYDLNNTRPITLLETPRKLMVKILNTRLGKVFSTHPILQPSQFAGLPEIGRAHV